MERNLPRMQRKEHRYQGILFDLDGTLIDHFSVIHRSINHALEHLKIEPVSYEKVRRTVGGSINVTMTRLIGEEKSEEAVRLFREEFDRIWHEDIRVLKGTRRLLKALREQGCRVGVFTNKEGNRSRQILDHVGLTPWLDTVVGTLDTPWRKPEEAFTRYALEQLGVDAKDACMVGDSPFDVQSGHVVDMPAFVVATGSHSMEALRRESDANGIFPDLIALAEGVFHLDLNRIACPLANRPDEPGKA